MHILLVACALLLPVCMSMIDAGKTGGIEAFNVFYTGSVTGHNVLIHNAEPGDEAIFQSMTNGAAVWENGKLYVDRTENVSLHTEDGDLSSDVVMSFQQEVAQILDNADNDALSAEYLDGIIQEIPFSNFSPWLWCAVLLFSAFVQTVLYRLFWDRKYTEYRTLAMIGGEDGQLLWLTMLEFSFTQLTASLLAFLLSAGGVALLTQYFLQLFVGNADTSLHSSQNWFVFCVNGKFVAGILLFMFCVGSIAGFLWFLRIRKRLLHTSKRPRTARHHIVLSRPTGVLQTFFLKQYAPVCISVLIAVPILIGAVLLLQMREELPVYTQGYFNDIYVGLRFEDRGRLDSEPQLQALSHIDGVEEITFTYMDNMQYLLLDDRMEEEEESGVHSKSGEEYFGFWAYIAPYDALSDADVADDTGSTPVDRIYKIALDTVYTGIIDKNEDGEVYMKEKIDYAVGELLRLYPCFGDYTLQLEVAENLDMEEADALRKSNFSTVIPNAENPGSKYIFIYLAPEDYAEIAAFREVSGFSVTLVDPSYAMSVQTALYDHFAEREITLLLNNVEDYLIEYNRVAGMNLLYTALGALLYGFFIVIISLMLVEYVRSQEKNLRLLHLQGASHRSMVAAFVQILIPPGILCCGAVWWLAKPVELAYYQLRGYTEERIAGMQLQGINDPRYLIAGIVVIAVFVLPAMLNVTRTLHAFDRE